VRAARMALQSRRASCARARCRYFVAPSELHGDRRARPSREMVLRCTSLEIPLRERTNCSELPVFAALYRETHCCAGARRGARRAQGLLANSQPRSSSIDRYDVWCEFDRTLIMNVLARSRAFPATVQHGALVASPWACALSATGKPSHTRCSAPARELGGMHARDAVDQPCWTNRATFAALIGPPASTDPLPLMIGVQFRVRRSHSTSSPRSRRWNALDVTCRSCASNAVSRGHGSKQLLARVRRQMTIQNLRLR